MSIYISTGVHELPEKDEAAAADDDERAFNTHLVIDPKGEITARYRKVRMLH